MGQAYGYLRKSSMKPGTVAPETQEREIRQLAARHEQLEIRMLADWDISGGRKATQRRAGYNELVAAIKDGRCSAVYSYSLSRLGRSVHELTGLFDLCEDKKVPIRLVADAVDTSTASGRMLANILASVAQFETEVASERQHARNRTKVLAGVSLRTRKTYGEMPGEDVNAVLNAVREAGSYGGAARLLNARGIMAKNGKPWWASSVGFVAQRQEPKTPKPGKGRKARSTFALSRLLICPTCGRYLTGGSTPQRRYACRYAESTPHPKTSISESKILPWVTEHTTGIKIPGKAVDKSVERHDLGDQRARLVDLLQHNLLDREDFAGRVESIDREIEKLDAMAQAPASVDWTASPDLINAELRRLLTGIELGPDFIPVALVMAWGGKTILGSKPITRWIPEEPGTEVVP